MYNLHFTTECFCLYGTEINKYINFQYTRFAVKHANVSYASKQTAKYILMREKIILSYLGFHCFSPYSKGCVLKICRFCGSDILRENS